ncbi:D-arabinitol 2-dehydrogenase [Ceratocystis lukuohia]|uniref:D-arabinitol 2-dehydrogenase n=1 Tax=Ceratocystis lukuohia TaxID=2019550 RepID=A0ABR4MBU9_9PEZI
MDSISEAPPTLSSFTLANRAVIVTGGASGLGAVMARAIVASGSSLAIADLNITAAETVASSIRADFPTAKISTHHVDVSSKESTSKCVADVVAHHGKVDGLVTSAGFVENFPAEEYPVNRMRKLWDVNVDGTYLFATEVARWMIGAGVKGSMFWASPYNVSKAAVRHMAASLAVEWSSKGIRVNCISPGYMRTALTEKIIQESPELTKPWVEMTPMKRMGDPADLEGPVTFLLSDAARYITGSDLRVDGGYTLL